MPCSARDFADLWSLRGLAETAGRRSVACHLLTAARADAERRSGRCAALGAIRFSADGRIGGLEAPETDALHYCYTFNAPGSPERHLRVASQLTDESLWEVVLRSGDVLEYRRSVGGGSRGAFTLRTVTSAAYCNGQRIAVTLIVNDTT